VSQIVAAWMRGGTSKCWVFERAELDVDGLCLDEVLLRLFGSPDPRQVDGVGGGTSTTSKAVILSRATDDSADVDYTFAQVGIDQPVVDWGSNCGNCSAVVGLYAVRRGWIQPGLETTAVRVRNTNTGQLIVQQVRTPGGVLDETASEWIPGVPFPGTGVRMWFVDPAGHTTGRLFPTGRRTDLLRVGPDSYQTTMVDAGAPLVLVPAAAFGLTGAETPAEIDARPALLDRLDAVRRAGAVAMGVAATAPAAALAVPKLALVAPADGGTAQLVVRMLSMGRVHPALAITGSVGLTLAARTEGTVVHRMVGDLAGDRFDLDTPAGVVSTWTGEHDGRPAVAVTRTARRLAEAVLLLPDDKLPPVDLVTADANRHDETAAEEVALDEQCAPTSRD
jgi:2-methylaconitate cis-trans-isomerase PrpF